MASCNIKRGMALLSEKASPFLYSTKSVGPHENNWQATLGISGRRTNWLGPLQGVLCPGILSCAPSRDGLVGNPVLGGRPG